MSFRRESIGPVRGSGPKNSQERIIADRDGVNHLEVFMNGSWRHLKESCKVRVNKQCNRG